jgi:phosphate transport system substrate-binding protein
MKKIITTIALAVIVLTGTKPVSAGTEQTGSKLKGNITISGAFALYPLAVKWGEEFKKLHPGVNFDIQAGGAGKGMTDVLSGTVTFGMLSRDVRPEEIEKGAVLFPTAKDAVLPTFAATNPHAKRIAERGVTLEEFKKVFIDQTITTWGQLLGVKDDTKIKVYVRSDAAGAAESWSKGIGGKTQEDLKGVAVFADPGLLGAVIKEKYSIGFNNIGFAYNIKANKLNPGVGIVPIDVNNNGKIDPDENFYGSVKTLMKAIVDGKYPSPPARALFFVTKGQPTDEATKAFLRWILTEGQKYVNEMGYVRLNKATLEKSLNTLK